MFYAHFVLAKKGPLAKIWLAAHWDKKLTKAHVFETNIESSVEGILQPKVKMALRTSGHLLLGIVRIYSRKAKYLLADCNEAFIKIKMAFRPGVVDLPEENRAAAVAAITLPEVFHDFEAAMQNITIDMDAQVTLNQSRVEDITMKEDYGTFSLMTDEGFEMGFDEADAGRDATNIEDGFDHTSFLLAEVRAKDMSIDVEQSVPNSDKPSTSLDAPLKDDGFGGTVGEGLLDSETGGLFEPAGLFDDAPLDNVSLENNATPQEENAKDSQDKPAGECNDNSDDDDDMYDMGPASMGGPSPPSSPDLCLNTGLDEPEPINPASSLDFVDTPQVPPEASGSNIEELNLSNTQMQPPPVSSSGLDETTLINNEDETFALAPLDFNISQNLERAGKVKRKRKLIVDEIKNISGEEMKSQLSDTADIVSSLDLAPPTKRLMHWKETGGVEKMFSLPGQTILSQSLSKIYLRNLTTRSVDNEDFGVEDDRIDLDADIEKPRDDEPMMARKRRREMDSLLAQDISHMDTMHLESSRHSYTPDHRISHPSLDVSNFLQNPHQMFSPISTPQMPSQQQLMPNIMPSIMQHPPPAHMIHPMLQNDINQLSHISQMMHPLNESNPHHPMASNMHNIQSPIVSESYNQAIHHSVIESVPQHLISDGISQLSDQMQHHPMQKQMLNHPSLQNQVNHQDTNHQFQKQVSQTGMNHMSCIENNLLQPPIDNQSLQNAIVDDEMTQPLLADQYMQPEVDRNSNAISVATSELPICDVPQPLTFNNQLASLQENQIQQVIPEIPNSIDKTVESQPDLNDFIPPSNSEEPPKENIFNNGEINQNKSNEVPVSDDDDDYGAPSSVGPALPEEQLADETYEQFEERILTKRTTHMLHTIENTLDTHHSVSFTELVRNNKRKQVAQKFYTFLVLKKQQAVELEQNSTYGDMIITKGPKFDALLNAN